MLQFYQLKNFLCQYSNIYKNIHCRLSSAQNVNKFVDNKINFFSPANRIIEKFSSCTINRNNTQAKLSFYRMLFNSKKHDGKTKRIVQCDDDDGKRRKGI